MKGSSWELDQQPNASYRDRITAAGVPDLNPGYETNAWTLVGRRVALAGIRLGQKRRALF